MAYKRVRRLVLAALLLVATGLAALEAPRLVWWYSFTPDQRACMESTQLDLFRMPGETEAEYRARWWEVMAGICGA